MYLLLCRPLLQSTPPIDEYQWLKRGRSLSFSLLMSKRSLLKIKHKSKYFFANQTHFKTLFFTSIFEHRKFFPFSKRMMNDTPFWGGNLLGEHPDTFACLYGIFHTYFQIEIQGYIFLRKNGNPSLHNKNSSPNHIIEKALFTNFPLLFILKSSI